MEFLSYSIIGFVILGLLLALFKYTKRNRWENKDTMAQIDDNRRKRRDCRNCIYYRGVCKRHAPVYEKGTPGDDDHKWPHIMDATWCGDHQLERRKPE